MRSLLSLLLLSACAQPLDDTGDEHAGGENPSDHPLHEEHGELPPALDALHAEVAPIWYMGEGEERRRLACESSARFVELSAEAGRGMASGARMYDAAEVLAGECRGINEDGISLAFEAFHDRFHEVMEQAQDVRDE